MTLSTNLWPFSSSHSSCSSNISSHSSSSPSRILSGGSGELSPAAWPDGRSREVGSHVHCTLPNRRLHCLHHHYQQQQPSTCALTHKYAQQARADLTDSIVSLSGPSLLSRRLQNPLPLRPDQLLLQILKTTPILSPCHVLYCTAIFQKKKHPTHPPYLWWGRKACTCPSCRSSASGRRRRARRRAPRERQTTAPAPPRPGLPGLAPFQVLWLGGRGNPRGPRFPEQ